MERKQKNVYTVILKTSLACEFASSELIRARKRFQCEPLPFEGYWFLVLESEKDLPALPQSLIIAECWRTIEDV